MRTPAAVAAAILAVLPAAVRAAPDCKVELGPRDRASRGETLVVRSGERLENAVALRGDLVVEAGAEVDKAVAFGGSVTVRSGGKVSENAVAIGGDVVVEGGGRVGKDAVSLGGQVREAAGAKVGGSAVGLAVQAGRGSLAGKILGKLAGLEDCAVIEKGGTGG